jgi:hypothetical protein
MSDTNTTSGEKGSIRHRSMCRGGRYVGLPCGIIMMVVGGLWFLQKVGLISLAWMHGIPFWPIVMMLFGAWIVIAGVLRRRRRGSETGC